MGRLIDGDALKDELLRLGFFPAIVKSAIERMPNIDAKPVVHGHWIIHTDDLFPMESTMECSRCHEHESCTLNNDNVCPNCGAQMDGGIEDG